MVIDGEQERDGVRQDPGCLKGRIMQCSSRSGDSEKSNRMDN